jgi:alkylation response protein AidB-like acyl-CoA dehydrogenase
MGDFRAELRAWLDAHVTDEFRAAGRGGALDPDPARLATLREWNRLLDDGGYAAVAWPAEFGGRGLGVLDQIAYAEEMDRAAAPPSLNPIGLANIAPSIMEHGTAEQTDRFLPAMRRGDDIWCQGFSEPDAGSDLASVRTAAVRDGDHYVVTGQKIWTTLGHLANWCELLVRTDPDAPKHKGLSCLLVDMTLPGVEVRPLATSTGDTEFNELFFDEVRVPVTGRLGPEHAGWQVAMTTLGNERGGVARLHVGARRRIGRLVDAAKASGRADDPAVRQMLARLYADGEVLKLIGDRVVTALAAGREPGPASSVAKLAWSRTEQEVAAVAAAVAGPDAMLAGPVAREIVYAPSFGIAGGTTEVNKSVVAQRVLGLPRDP